MMPRRSLVLVGSVVTPSGVIGTSNTWISPKHHHAFVTRSTRRIRKVQQCDSPLPSPTRIKRFEESCSTLQAESAQPSSNEQRKKKNNKYAQFSKSTALDPMDEMLLESRSKLKQIAQTSKSKKKKSASLVDNSLEAVEELLASVDESLHEEEEEKHIWERNKRHFPDNKSIDPYDPTTYGYIELGTIIGPHGVHGALKLSSITDFPLQRLCTSGIRHLKPPNRRSPRQVTLLEGRIFQSPPAGSDVNPIYLITLDGVEGRDEAAKLKGCVLYCLEEETVEGGLEEDEYIVSDLVGMNVFLSQDSESATGKGFEDLFVGFIDGVVLGSEMCAIPGLGQDMFEIALPSEYGGQGDDRVLVPFVPQIVVSVDLEGRMVVIDPPKGLLELSYRREVKVKLKGLLPEISSYQST